MRDIIDCVGSVQAWGIYCRCFFRCNPGRNILPSPESILTEGQSGLSCNWEPKSLFHFYIMTIFVSIWPDRAVCLLSVCVIISFDLDTWHTSSLWQYLGYVWRSGSLIQICGQRRNIAKVVDATLSEGFCSCHIRWLVCWFMLAINLTTLFKKFVCFISHRALCWTMILTWRLSRLLRWLCLRLFKTIFLRFYTNCLEKKKSRE